MTSEELADTARYLASLQVRSGQIPWFVGGHSDPWNHVEVAMALTVTGYLEEARAAYRWLADTQLGDGSWFNYYVGERPKDTRLDTNVCAYVAAGLYHYVLATDDVDFAVELWPVVEKAMAFVLRWQLSDGTIRWSLDAQGRRGAPRTRRVAPPRSLRSEERVRDGLVLPDLLRSTSWSAR